MKYGVLQYMANPQKNGKKKSDEKESGSYGAK
jgi:hypothetical protein